MFLSIIVPVYNAERYLAECLDSLLQQDINVDDYEIICVDDGSTDRSLEILLSYSNNINIKVFHQENAGVSNARNTGMAIASGDYYWFVDGDDFVLPNALGKLKKLCKTQPCDILSFRLYYFDDAEATIIKEKIQSGGVISSNSPLRAQQTMLIKRGLVGPVLWREGIEVGEDAIFLRELALCNPRMLETNDTFYFYRQHASSSIHKARNPQKRMLSHVKAAAVMQSIYQGNGGRCEANANYLRMFVILALSSIAQCRAENNKQWETAFQIMVSNGLFPFSAPPECTSKKNYITERTDVLGKALGILGEISGTRVGFNILTLWFSIYGLIKGKK